MNICIQIKLQNSALSADQCRASRNWSFSWTKQNIKCTGRTDFNGPITYSGDSHIPHFKLKERHDLSVIQFVYIFFSNQKLKELRYSLLHNPRGSTLSLLLHLFILRIMSDSTIKWVQHWSIKGPATCHGDVISCPSSWSSCSKLCPRKKKTRTRACVCVCERVCLSLWGEYKAATDGVSAVHYL